MITLEPSHYICTLSQLIRHLLLLWQRSISQFIACSVWQELEACHVFPSFVFRWSYLQFFPLWLDRLWCPIWAVHKICRACAVSSLRFQQQYALLARSSHLHLHVRLQVVAVPGWDYSTLWCHMKTQLLVLQPCSAISTTHRCTSHCIHQKFDLFTWPVYSPLWSGLCASRLCREQTLPALLYCLPGRKADVCWPYLP